MLEFMLRTDVFYDCKPTPEENGKHSEAKGSLGDFCAHLTFRTESRDHPSRQQEVHSLGPELPRGGLIPRTRAEWTQDGHEQAHWGVSDASCSY